MITIVVETEKRNELSAHKKQQAASKSGFGQTSSQLIGFPFVDRFETATVRVIELIQRVDDITCIVQTGLIQTLISNKYVRLARSDHCFLYTF